MLVFDFNVQWRGAALFYFFIFSAFLVPNHYQPWFNFYCEYLAFLGLWFLWVFSRREDLVGGVPVLWLLVFLALAWLQFLFSTIEYLETVWLVSFYLLSAILAFMLGRQAGVVELGGACFLALGIISAGIALGQWFDIWESIWLLTSGIGARATANIAQANHFVTLLGLALVSALWLRAKGVIGEGVFALVMVWLVAGMVLAVSRMAFLQYVSIGFFWYFLSGKKGTPSGIIYILGFIFLVVGASWQADLAVALYLIEPDRALGVFERVGTTDRLHIWWQLILAAWDKGGWGYGWGQVAVAQVDYALSYPVPKFTLHAHNIAVDILIWNGFLIGLAALVSFGGWMALVLWRARNEDSAYAAMCVVVISIHAFLEYPLEYSYFLIPYFLYLGYLGGRKVDFRKLMFFFASLVFLVFLVIVWRDYRYLERDFRSLRFEMARLGVAEYSVSDNKFILLDGMGSFISFMRMQLPGSLDNKIDEARRLVYRHPYVPAFYRYVLLLVEGDRYDEAFGALSRMRSIHGEVSYFGTLSVLRVDAEYNPTLRGFVDYVDRQDGVKTGL